MTSGSLAQLLYPAPGSCQFLFPQEFSDTRGGHQEAVQDARRKENEEMPKSPALASQHVWYKDSGLGSCGAHGIHANLFRFYAVIQEVSRFSFSESSLNENILPFLLTSSKWHQMGKGSSVDASRS